MTRRGRRSARIRQRQRARLRLVVLRLGGRLGWGPRDVIGFAEALTNRPWRQCGRTSWRRSATNSSPFAGRSGAKPRGRSCPSAAPDARQRGLSAMLLRVRRRASAAPASRAGRDRDAAHERRGHHAGREPAGGDLARRAVRPGDRRDRPGAAIRGPRRQSVRCGSTSRTSSGSPTPRRSCAGSTSTRSPASTRPGATRTSRLSACTLDLRRPAYLPLRIFRDPEVAADRAAQADPVLGHPGGARRPAARLAGAQPAGPRTGPGRLVQGLPAPAVEHPLASERAGGRADTSLAPVFMLAGLLVAGCLAFQGYRWFDAGPVAEPRPAGRRHRSRGASVGPGSPDGCSQRPIYDMRLVQEKISRIAYSTEIRLAVFAPADDATSRPMDGTPGPTRRGLPAVQPGGRQRPGAATPPRRAIIDLRELRPLAPREGTEAPVLNTRELAGLWHLPQAQADVPLLERTGAASASAKAVLGHARLSDRRLRPPGTRRCRSRCPTSCCAGTCCWSPRPVAGSRRCCSASPSYLMESTATDGRPPALVLVDPHRDLAEAVARAGAAPAGATTSSTSTCRSGARPFGLNLLDVGLGWDRDKAVSNALAIFRREFDRFWGPRMEDAFRFALLTLFEANQAICADDAAGREPAAHHPPGADRPRRRRVPAERARARLATRSSRPGGPATSITSTVACRIEIQIRCRRKCNKFAGSRAARSIVGQPRSTIDPSGWLQSGAIVVVNTAKGTVGEDTAALIGGSLINLVGLLVGEQAALPDDRRRPSTLIVDEFHTMPGADYEGILSELAKYGASLILATQSLARLEALDRDQGRSLRATVFANLDGLFAFHTSAEDARYLVRELGERDRRARPGRARRAPVLRQALGRRRAPADVLGRARSATDERSGRPRRPR